MRTIFILLLLWSSANADLIRNASNTVIDTDSGLEWQDNLTADKRSQPQAILYCNALILDGDKWRLPSIDELKTIVDTGRNAPAIAGAFKHTQAHKYWSSTTIGEYEKKAMYVNFFSGNVDSADIDDAAFVRCVRDTDKK